MQRKTDLLELQLQRLVGPGRVLRDSCPVLELGTHNIPSLGGNQKFFFDEIKKNFNLSKLIVWGSMGSALCNLTRTTSPLTMNRIICLCQASGTP